MSLIIQQCQLVLMSFQHMFLTMFSVENSYFCCCKRVCYVSIYKAANDFSKTSHLGECNAQHTWYRTVGLWSPMGGVYQQICLG